MLEWAEKQAAIQQEGQRDGWYLLHTNCPVTTCAKEQVLGHYQNLLDVEAAFCQLKHYLEVRPIHPWRPDRVRNQVRLCFLAHWLSARLGKEWQACGEQGELVATVPDWAVSPDKNHRFYWRFSKASGKSG